MRTLITESSGAAMMRVLRGWFDVSALMLRFPALPEDVPRLMVESMRLHNARGQYNPARDGARGAYLLLVSKVTVLSVSVPLIVANSESATW
jgi:hypothetical protein